MNADGSGRTTLIGGSSSRSSQTEWRENYDDPHSEKIIPFVRIQTFSEEWRNFSGPSFSPDGSQLALAEGAGKRIDASICAVKALNDPNCIGFGEPGAYNNFEFHCIACGSHIIAINSINGSVIGELTPIINEREDFEPAYSAGGALAFVRWAPGGSSIFVIGSPGAPPSRVTGARFDSDPDFSPDGSKIVFSHRGEDIGLVGVGGGAVTILPVPAPSENAESYVSGPSFSPDGSRIVFHRAVFGPGKDKAGLFTMGLDGSGFSRIVEAGYDPTWQPLHLQPQAIRAKAKARKGRVKLDKKGRATVGTIVCGSTPCKLMVLSAKLKAGKRRCSVKTRLAKKLAPGKSAKLRVKVSGKCLAALKKAGKGLLVTRVRVTDALGKKVLTLKSTLVPAKAKRAAHRK